MPIACCAQYLQKRSPGIWRRGRKLVRWSLLLFKLSPSRREDFAEIQQNLGLEEVVFLQHVESRWLSLLPAVERVKEQFPALLEYFNKLPEADKKIKAIQKDHVYLNISWNHSSALLPARCETSLWQISGSVSDWGATDPCIASINASSFETADAEVPEGRVHWKDCYWAVVFGFKTSGLAVGRWKTWDWGCSKEMHQRNEESWKTETVLPWH